MQLLYLAEKEGFELASQALLRCPALSAAAWPPCQPPTAAPEISPLLRRRRRSKSQPAPDPALGPKVKNKAAT